MVNVMKTQTSDVPDSQQYEAIGVVKTSGMIYIVERHKETRKYRFLSAEVDLGVEL